MSAFFPSITRSPGRSARATISSLSTIVARHADDVFGPGEKHDEASRFTGEIAIGDVTVWGDESWKWVQLYTGDDRSDVARRSVAVEPMTCRRDAFRTGEDLIRLEPGERWAGVWGIRV